jgi:lysophospholipase L1-like esterase
MFAVLVTVAVAQPPEIAPPPRVANPFAKWEKNILAIEKRLAANPPRPGAVFFTGSSSIVGWNLTKWFPDSGFVNVGFGGSHIPDCTHFAPRILTPHKPGTVVFYAGDNDIAAGRKAQRILDDFKAFVSAVRADNPTCRVLFISVKPSLAQWKRFDEQKKANALVREFCEKGERLTFVDIVSQMLGLDGMPNPELFVKDGLHMTPKGFEIWTAAVTRALKP